MPSLAPPQRFRAFTAGSATSPPVPLVGGKLYTYAAGTTMPKATFADASGQIPNTNPVVLNARGEADVWLGDGAYKFVLTDAAGVQQGGPVDNIKSLDQFAADAQEHTDALRLDLAATGSTKGPALVGWLRAAAGAVAATLYRWLSWQPINVFEFLTDAQRADVLAGTKLLDVSAGIQKAIDASKTGMVRKPVVFPAGKYRINTAINLATGSGHDHNLVRLVGESRAWDGTEIVGATGGIMFDCTGSSDIKLENMLLRSEASTPNPSTVGILYARGSVSTYCANNVLRDVQIYIKSNPSANGGIGSVGIWNIAGEQHTYDHVYIWANLPVCLSVDPNPINLGPIASVYTTQLATQISLGVVNLIGSCSLATLDFYRPALYLNGTNSVNVDGAYMGAVPGDAGVALGTYTFAIENWNSSNFHHRGTVERHSQYMKNPRDLSGADINVVISDPRVPSLPYFDITPQSTQGTVQNSEIYIFSGVGNTNMFYSSLDPGSAALLNCEVYGTNTIPANILVNSINVDLFGANGELIGLRRQMGGGRAVPSIALGVNEFNTRLDVELGTTYSLGLGSNTGRPIIQAFDRVGLTALALGINPFGGTTQMGGPVELTPNGGVIYLRSPDGTRYKLSIANGGGVSVVAG